MFGLGENRRRRGLGSGATNGGGAYSPLAPVSPVAMAEQHAGIGNGGGALMPQTAQATAMPALEANPMPQPVQQQQQQASPMPATLPPLEALPMVGGAAQIHPPAATPEAQPFVGGASQIHPPLATPEAQPFVPLTAQQQRAAHGVMA